MAVALMPMMPVFKQATRISSFGVLTTLIGVEHSAPEANIATDRLAMVT